MLRCSVSTCKNNSLKTKNKTPKVTYHRFPKDPVLRQIWVLLCQRKKYFNLANNHICSEHFKEENFKDDMKHRLMGWPLRRILYETAIPSCNLNSNTSFSGEKRTNCPREHLNETEDMVSNLKLSKDFDYYVTSAGPDIILRKMDSCCPSDLDNAPAWHKKLSGALVQRINRDEIFNTSNVRDINIKGEDSDILDDDTRPFNANIPELEREFNKTRLRLNEFNGDYKIKLLDLHMPKQTIELTLMASLS